MELDKLLAVCEQWLNDRRVDRPSFPAGYIQQLICYVRASDEMPCIHPAACVVSSSHIEGVVTTNHCGWCASIQRAEAAEKQLAEKGDLIDSYSNAAHTQSLELDATRQHLIKAQGRIEELEAVVEAGEALISDVQWRHPETQEEGFTCQFMAGLAAAIRKYREGHGGKS